MRQIEATGKSVNDAIENGLKLLGLTLCDVDVEILQQKGFFRPAKVRLTVTADGADELLKEFKKEVEAEIKAETKTDKPVFAPKKEEKKPVAEVKKNEQKNQPKKQEKPAEKKEEIKKPASSEPVQKKKEEPKKPVVTEKNEVKKEENKKPAKPVSPEQVKRATDYLGKLLPLMKIDAEIKVINDKGGIDIDLVTTDSTVIGHRGEVLEALSSLVKRAVEESDDQFIRVTIDSNGYRAKREQSLIALANRMAGKCIRTGRKVVLEPMSNTHRKVIHSTLSSNDKIITRSEGTEPNRRVVIMLKRKGKNE